MILALKTDSDPAVVHFLDDSGGLVKKKEWSSGRTLAKNLLSELNSILDGDFQQLTGLIVFSGPGSFTGLRIGATVMNTIAYSENVPIVGVSGECWLQTGLERLANNENDKIVIPNYGAKANITKPKK